MPDEDDSPEDPANSRRHLPPSARVRQDDADAYAACLGALTCDDLYGPRWTVGCPTPRLAQPKPLAAACRSDFECESGACTGSSTECGKCVARKSAGESCAEHRECPRGGYCDQRCFAVAYLGEVCDEHRICGNGLRCVVGKCAKSGAVGDSCAKDLDCDFAHLVQCNTGAGKCEKAALLDPGSACPKAFDDGPPASCAKGSSCIRPGPDEAGTCVANAKVGEACGSSVRCEAFVNCRAGKCVPPTWTACP